MAFDSSRDPRTPFSLRQYGDGMAIQRYSVDEHGFPQRPWLKVDHVFQEGERVLLTLTSGRGATAIYVNGVLTRQSSTLGLVRKDLTGSLVLANSTVDESWPGEISQLAIYGRELTPTQVRGHFENGMGVQRPLAASEEPPSALYLFNERDGKVAHNQMDPATDLMFPARYLVLHPAFLGPLWDQYHDSGAAWTRWSYWEDVAVNVAGFIPVGFVFMAYFSSVRNIRCCALFVIMLGFAMSFTIETLQWFLPTRDSGMTDLVTNTAGTAFGVALFRLSWIQAIVSEARQSTISMGQDDQGGIVIGTNQQKMPFSA